MRKVYVDINVKLIFHIEEELDIIEVLDEMDYEFESNHPGAELLDTEIEDYEITESK